jgi:hypothetical protein
MSGKKIGNRQLGLTYYCDDDIKMDHGTRMGLNRLDLSGSGWDRWRAHVDTVMNLGIQ